MKTMLNSKAEKNAKEALKLDMFKGFDLDNAKDKLASLLSHVGSNGMFSEYTKHDITHVNGLLSQK